MRSFLISPFLLFVLVCQFSIAAHAGPLRWAWRTLWGEPEPQQTVIRLVGDGNIAVSGDLSHSSGQVAAAINNQTQALQAQTDQKAQAEESKRKEVQRQVLARLDEVSKVKSILAARAKEKGYDYEFEIETAMVKGKKLVKEDNFDLTQSTCSRQILESFLASLSYEENKKFLESASVKKLTIQILDNRESARPDMIFGIGMTISKPVAAVPATTQFKFSDKVKWESGEKAEFKKTYDNLRAYGLSPDEALATALSRLDWRDDIVSFTTRKATPATPGALVLNGFIGDSGCLAMDDEIHTQMALWQNPDIKPKDVMATVAGDLDIRAKNMSSASIALNTTAVATVGAGKTSTPGQAVLESNN